jgi:hypothetical protein
MLSWRCTCHLCSLLLFAVQIVLVALAALLGWILLRDDIPVPSFLHGRIERELARIGLEASFTSAQFDPTGRIFVRGLRLQPARFHEPVFEADRVYIRLDPVKLLAGRPELDVLEAEHARILCPPAISPSGVSETILDVSSLTLRHARNVWTLEGLVARVGPVHLAARGLYRAAPPSPDAPPPDIDSILAAYARHAPTVVRARARLAQFSEPVVQLVFEGAGDTIDATLEIVASEWHDPAVGHADDVLLRLDGALENGSLARPLRATLSARSAVRPDLVGIEAPRVSAEWTRLPTAASPWPDRVEAAASRIAHPKASLPALHAVASISTFPRVTAALSVPFDGEVARIELEGDAIERAGTARVHGRLGRTWLQRASEILGRDVTYYAQIADPPDFAAEVTVEPGLRWQRVEARVRSGPIVARGVSLDRARILGTITPERVHLRHLEASRGDEAAVGTYEDALATRDYRFVLSGAMRPHAISPWFGGWWERFWRDYGFHAAAPVFEVDVQGNWIRGHETRVSGRMLAEAVTMRDRPFNAAQARFFVRPDWYDLYDARLRRVEGTIDGEVQLRFRPGERDPALQTWTFDSTADIVSLAGIFGPGGDALFEPYRYDVPPRVSGRGTITQKRGVYDTSIDLRIQTSDTFRYYDFPLEALDTSVIIRDSRVELPDVRARYAGGEVTGKAVVDAGTLRFDAKLVSADYDLAVQRFSEFLDLQDPETAAREAAKPATGEGLGDRKIGGKLSLTLAAEGPLADIEGYVGTGQVDLVGGDLAQVKLFGPLSTALTGLGIKLGTLQLSEAASRVEVRREKLVFPNLRITGKTGALETDGTYLLPDGSLDFKARLFPLRESSGFFTQVFGLLLEPVSNLLEMRLTGTLDEPRWNFTRDPFSILRELNRKKEAEEQAAAAAAAAAAALVTPTAPLPPAPPPPPPPPQR